jgi:phenylalanyl-tRNA synthetase alpha chain
MTNVTSAIERWSGLPADIIRRPPIVLITDNYDRLFYEPDAVARSARYSHYIDDKHMLRPTRRPPSRRCCRKPRAIG